MKHITHDVGVAAQIGNYSDAIETAPNLRWLHTSGTPGLSKEKQLPKEIAAQSKLAWAHILEVLNKAGMTVGDIVKVTQYLVRPEDIPAYVRVRSEVLGSSRPAFMLLVVSQLIWPEVLVEVEVVAASAMRSKA